MFRSVCIISAVAMMAAAVSSASAAIIDDFSLPVAGQTVTQNGVGTNPVLMSGLGASTISGDRLVTVTVTTSAGTAGGAVKINNARPGAAEVNSDSDADSGATFTYGSGTPMNADLSSTTGLQVRILASDIPNTSNSITITSGASTSTAAFTIPGLIGLGGPASPYDVFIPWASFVGFASSSDVDTLTLSINGPRGSDYTFDFVQTYVPEPASLSMLGAGVAGLVARRRR